MRILITNDDGYTAPGLKALEEIAQQLIAKTGGEIWVVAPETNQSGAGHSLSLHDPLRMRSHGERRYEVRGTPTDCVIMATRHLMKDRRPDLVLSGVNRGQNMAEDVTYSGTIAAAFEGTLLGLRSIALSQAFGPTSREMPRFETAVAHGAGIIERLLKLDWTPGVLMNVNFPDRAPDDVLGTVVTVQGRRDMNLVGIEERTDTFGQSYYWLGFDRRRTESAAGTDLAAVYSGHISVTPLSLDLTATAMIDKLRGDLAG